MKAQCFHQISRAAPSLFCGCRSSLPERQARIKRGGLAQYCFRRTDSSSSTGGLSVGLRLGCARRIIPLESTMKSPPIDRSRRVCPATLRLSTWPGHCRRWSASPRNVEGSVPGYRHCKLLVLCQEEMDMAIGFPATRSAPSMGSQRKWSRHWSGAIQNRAGVTQPGSHGLDKEFRPGGVER